LSVWDHLFKKTLRNVKRRENIVRIWFLCLEMYCQRQYALPIEVFILRQILKMKIIIVKIAQS
jgi:hypothetical protein